MQLPKAILAGLLSLSLAACGTLSTPQARSLPSAQLLADCPIPARRGDDNSALANLALEQRLALLACNADKAALREWAK